MNEEDLKKLVPHFVEAMALKVHPGDVLVLKGDKPTSHYGGDNQHINTFVHAIAESLGATGIFLGSDFDFLVLRKHNGEAEENQETSRAEGTD